MAEKTQNPGVKAPRFAPLPVVAVVRDAGTGEEVAKHRFDFNDLDRRKWFNEKLCIWAFLNPDRRVAVEVTAESPAASVG